MTSHTDKYQLSQWEKSDKILMEDFNSDNQKIEDALAGLAASKAEQSELDALTAALPDMPKIAFGTYVGTGTYGAKNLNSITFPFKPKLVILAGDYIYAIILEGQPKVEARRSPYHIAYQLTWEDTTLSWYASSVTRDTYSSSVAAVDQMNQNKATYYYFAIG